MFFGVGNGKTQQAAVQCEGLKQAEGLKAGQSRADDGSMIQTGKQQRGQG